MVMKPEPWGEALDAVLTPGATLVVPTPGGAPFTQAVARELAGREHLVVACGRYEGIDQRVPDHYATTHDVRELSIGDYVLNGGEVAAHSDGPGTGSEFRVRLPRLAPPVAGAEPAPDRAATAAGAGARTGPRLPRPTL